MRRFTAGILAVDLCSALEKSLPNVTETAMNCPFIGFQETGKWPLHIIALFSDAKDLFPPFQEKIPF
jgi:hypothetical protein